MSFPNALHCQQPRAPAVDSSIEKPMVLCLKKVNFSKAIKVYLNYRGEKNQVMIKSLEIKILEDFPELKKAGINRSDMDKNNILLNKGESK